MKKTYFIGLGGSGLRTVSQIQKKVHQSSSADEYLFTYMDTDKLTFNSINKNDNLINRCDYVDLGETNPYRLYKQAVETNDKESQGRDSGCHIHKKFAGMVGGLKD